ncbi:hypothetical protein MRX96_029068 [Rhipicephalus microplus]
MAAATGARFCSASDWRLSRTGGHQFGLKAQATAALLLQPLPRYRRATPVAYFLSLFAFSGVPLRTLSRHPSFSFLSPSRTSPAHLSGAGLVGEMLGSSPVGRRRACLQDLRTLHSSLVYKIGSLSVHTGHLETGITF